MTTLTPCLGFAWALVTQALTAGADAAQVFVEEQTFFEIQATRQGIDLVRSNVNDSAKLTIFKDGRKGETVLNGLAGADTHQVIELGMEAALAGFQDGANQVWKPSLCDTEAIVSIEAPSAPVTSYGPATFDKEMMIKSLLEYLDDVSKMFPKVNVELNNVVFTLVERRFVNSKGVCQHERRGYYYFGTLFSAMDEEETTSWNYTNVSSYQPFQKLLDTGVTCRVLGEADRSFNPQPVAEKFVGDVIITPECMGMITLMLTGDQQRGALSGYALLAKTSPYTEKKGAQIASPSFTLRNEPRSSELPMGSDFDAFGVRTRDVDIIKDGVLENFLIDFYLSKKLAMPQTAGVNAMTVAPGETSIEKIIANTERGIILARYSGGLPNAQLDFSGVAKSSFYVEDGVVRYPLVATMVSGNFQELLMNIRALSCETVNFGDGVYPYMAASGVTISSK
ncbi:MAG: TldD/PmbA family protein [Deltaproteobacteria bacterium]|nr:TldD/PmbA family protein [Deltaproteobacteria bacterium]